MKLNQALISFDRLFAMFVGIVFVSMVLIPVQTSAKFTTERSAKALGARTIRVVPTTAQVSGTVTVSIEIDSQGDEAAASFTVYVDPTVFNNPVVTLGSGVPVQTTLTLNTEQSPFGFVGVLINSPNTFTVSPPNRQIINITYNVTQVAAVGPSTISFVGSPTPLGVSTLGGVLVPTVFQSGVVTITPRGPTFVTIGGRVTTPSGQNIRNATVTLIDSNNVRRVATTSTFGLYSFDNVATGSTYTLTVGSRRFRFTPRMVNVTEPVSNLDLQGLE